MTPGPQQPFFRRPHRLIAQLDTTVEPSQQGILDELRRVLTTGAAAPGFALPVDEIAAAFQVSRIPVREALKTLTGEGLLEHEPRGGYTVARLSLADFAELYVVRSALEAAALPVAADVATPEDRVRAGRALDAEGRALHDGDAATYHRSSRAFHLALVTPSGMQRLLGLIESTWNITEPAQPMSLLLRSDLEALHDEHTAMHEAWAALDVPRLLTLADEHTAHLLSALQALPADHVAFAPADLPADLPADISADISAGQRAGNTGGVPPETGRS